MKPYRVLVTGSRDWPDHDIVRDALVAAIYQNVPAVIVHGACPSGADAMASWWVRRYRHLDVTEEAHPANWRPGGTFDRGAGYKRNAAMVNLGADVCLAFIAPCTQQTCRKPKPHGSHGATHCADAAERAGIPVRRWTS